MTKQRRHSHRESNQEANISSDKRPSYAMEMNEFVLKSEPKNALVLKLSYHHLVVFLSGILAACVYYHFPWPGGNSRQLQHLPAVHYIQVRDDFAIYSQDTEQLQRQALKEFYGESGAAVANVPTEAIPNVKEALGSLKLAMDMYKLVNWVRHKSCLSMPRFSTQTSRGPTAYGEYLEHPKRYCIGRSILFSGINY
ncbi:hypothetical protein DOY81_014754 [Sarcophaga bullata]|nr:hypothetical protein DOY81_014754 [Sarcophaga bullata]